MKGTKLISIDSDILEELQKESNASKIINELLKDYYTTGGALQRKEIIHKININGLEITKLEESNKSLKSKLDALTKREAELKDLYKNIPAEVIEDFKAFPNMTSMIFRGRIKDIYNRKYKDLNHNDMMTAFNHYYNKEESNGN